MKYASYCSTLSKEHIKNIYQLYLNKFNEDENAVARLSDFYKLEYDEISLNQGQTQRIIIVAANFRKEVTSTVLWLLNYKLRIQCFKATPFALNEQLFLNLEQIIPTKDTEDFIISMADKTQEEITTQESKKARHNLRFEFWAKILPLLKGKTSIFQNVNPSKDYWLNSGGTGISGAKYSLVVTKKYAAVQLEFAKSDRDDNKRYFDELSKYLTEIESKFGDLLIWERMDDNISSKVAFYKEDVNIFNKDEWDFIVNFLLINIIKLEVAMREALLEVKKAIALNDEEIREFAYGK